MLTIYAHDETPLFSGTKQEIKRFIRNNNLKDYRIAKKVKVVDAVVEKVGEEEVVVDNTSMDQYSNTVSKKIYNNFF